MVLFHANERVLFPVQLKTPMATVGGESSAGIGERESDKTGL